MDCETGLCSELASPGYPRVTALHRIGNPTGTRTGACRFMCDDGATYWVKHWGVCGLGAELIAGRVGSSIGLTPPAAIVFVPRALTESISELEDFGDRDCFGSRDMPDCVNARDLVAGTSFASGALSPSHWANVVVFQTWIGHRDQQVLINIRTGESLSLDHEEWDAFNGDSKVDDIRETPLPFQPPPDCKISTYVSAAVDVVEGIKDSNLVTAASHVPCASEWVRDSGVCWSAITALKGRRNQVRNVMARW